MSTNLIVTDLTVIIGSGTEPSLAVLNTWQVLICYVSLTVKILTQIVVWRSVFVAYMLLEVVGQIWMLAVTAVTSRDLKWFCSIFFTPEIISVRSCTLCVIHFTLPNYHKPDINVTSSSFERPNNEIFILEYSPFGSGVGILTEIWNQIYGDLSLIE